MSGAVREKPRHPHLYGARAHREQAKAFDVAEMVLSEPATQTHATLEPGNRSRKSTGFIGTPQEVGGLFQ